MTTETSSLSEKNQLDHLLWASSPLAKGVNWLEAITGVRAEEGGSHPDFGTCNAIARLGEDAYLEVIAPDTTQKLEGTWGGQISELPTPRLWRFAVRTTMIDRLRDRLMVLGLTGKVARMSRQLPSGERVSWRLLLLSGHEFGDVMPFFIQWDADTKHPTADLPQRLELEEFTVGHPRTEKLADLFRRLDVPVRVIGSEKATLVAMLESPKGHVRLAS